MCVKYLNTYTTIMLEHEPTPSTQRPETLEDFQEIKNEYAPEDGFYNELDFHET